MQRVHSTPNNKVRLARTSLEDEATPANLPDRNASTTCFHRLVEQGVSDELGALARVDAGALSGAGEVEVERFRRGGTADEDTFAGELGWNFERRETFLEQRETEVTNEEGGLEGREDRGIRWLFGRSLLRVCLFHFSRRSLAAAVGDRNVGPVRRRKR